MMRHARYAGRDWHVVGGSPESPTLSACRCKDRDHRHTLGDVAYSAGGVASYRAAYDAHPQAIVGTAAVAFVVGLVAGYVIRGIT